MIGISRASFGRGGKGMTFESFMRPNVNEKRTPGQGSPNKSQGGAVNARRTAPRIFPTFGWGVRGTFRSERLGSGIEVNPQPFTGLGVDGAAGQD